MHGIININLSIIGINPNIAVEIFEKEIIMTRHVHAIHPAQSDRARFESSAKPARMRGEGSETRKGSAIGWLADRVTDAWSRRVARAYADARLGEAAPADPRMMRELQAVASHQRDGH